MRINTTAWNRIRYGAAAPFYNLVTAPLQPSAGPLEILKRRYARGEIDNEEFKEKKRGLV